jgi:CBS domain containing-hemolysin-like protein
MKGDADTIAGLILELRGDFPSESEIINCKNFSFHIEAVDDRKIIKIKVIKNE